MKRWRIIAALVVVLVLLAGLALVATAEASVPGDVNGDGHVDLLDLTLVAAAYHSRPGMSNWNPDADLNHDGQVNLTDLVIVGLNYHKY